MWMSLARDSTARWRIQFVSRTMGRPSMAAMSSSSAGASSSGPLRTTSSLGLTMLSMTSFMEVSMW